MFEGFTESTVQTSGASIRIRSGGHGPPLLLLHGFPQTGAMWHLVAPRLAEKFTVVVPDLRGYGASSKPPTDAAHSTYSKRAMALDQVEVMSQLGFNQFRVAGHDRGGRCAYRLALDHPERIVKVAVLDIVPTGEAFRRADMALRPRLAFAALGSPRCPIAGCRALRSSWSWCNQQSSAAPAPLVP